MSSGQTQGTWIFIVIVVFVIGIASGFVVAKLTTPTPVEKPVVENVDKPNEDMVEGDDSPAGVVDIIEVKKGDVVWHAAAPKKEYNGLLIQEVGSVTKGTFAGGKIVNLFFTGGMGIDRVPQRIVVKDGKGMFLVQYSAEWGFDEFQRVFEVEFPQYLQNPTKVSDVIIEELDAPPSLKFSNGVEITHRENGMVPTNDEKLPKEKTVEGFEVVRALFDDGDYGISDGGFFLKMPDGTYENYVYEVPFIEGGIISGTIQSGKPIPGNYTYGATAGCGFGVNLVLAPSRITLKDLKVIGVVGGEKQNLYVLKNTNDAYLKDVYNAYKQFAPKDALVSYENFIAANPILFWQDPWGRLVRFMNTSFVAGAECGKPVIYLYPQEKTNVNVKVAPKGGFSVTEPQYPEGGWNVVASPDGTLVDVRDNKTWPYLFWEGNGTVEGIPNKKGFVVARRDVEKTLQEKLALMGLNKKETTDFMEFWLPRMQSAPYYFITFYDGALMNRIAPLAVTPKPDSVIRILMDYEPLQSPRKVEPLEIRTPQRNGFTVVEWGGVLK